MAGKRKPPEPVGDSNDPIGMAVLRDQFFEWMLVRNYSEETVVTRHCIMNGFIRWAEQRGVVRPNEVTRPMVERYQRYLHHYRKKNGNPIGFRTQHGNLIVLRSWFRWLARNNHVLYNPLADIDLPKCGRRLPRHVLSPTEAEQVIAVADPSTNLGLRDRAILETLYSSALRRTETCNLQLYDIDYERGALMVRLGKGQKDRIVPIGERALAWIERYIAEVRPLLESADTEDNTLFLTEVGKTITPAQLSLLVRRYVDAADVGKRGACHLWRHTAATVMLDAGADIRLIQAFLGHACLTTTQIYTHVSIRQLKAIHTAFHPLATN